MIGGIAGGGSGVKAGKFGGGIFPKQALVTEALGHWTSGAGGMAGRPAFGVGMGVAKPILALPISHL